MLAKGDGLAPAPPALDAAADASLADEDREMLATARGVGDAMRPHMLTLRFDLALREVAFFSSISLSRPRVFIPSFLFK